MPVPAITLRLEKGSPLTALEGDNNFDALRDFSNALETRMDAALNADGSVKTPLVLYGASASATDEYVISVNYTAVSYTDFLGKIVLLKADVANTGPTTPATLKINPLATAIAIKRFKDQELSNGDIKAGQIALLTYDGTFFQLHNPSTLPPDNYHADDGTAAAYRINLATNPVGNFSVPYAYYTGYTVRFKTVNANSGPATLQVQSPAVTLAATSLRRWDGTELAANDILAGAIIDATYDGTNFRILSNLERHFNLLDSAVLPTSDTVRTFAHGLGMIPRSVRVVLVCTTAQSGYVVNDEVGMEQGVSTAGGKCYTVSADATNVYISYDNSTNIGLVPRAGGAALNITKANWKFKVYASTL